ncbi:LCP family protein [Actinopolymorpha rutila]|uniref:LCP family protein required for cell wall assembly n=1 Tax=Actinopolymorpha rutila TaxID=446787 RepID=A0A852ZSR2_9ACTN|nr:LCP family protein [Actinopolymorpha rutila]NYH91666.1 LCP family protein required for cell wall assembly [Actinopolymorpha rutila]
MTLGAPGSAQLVAGNRVVGKFALRVAAAVLSVAVLLALVGLVSPRILVSLISDPGVLRFGQIVLLVVAVGWLALFVDAWRLGRPLRMRQKQRLTSTVTMVAASVLAVSLVLTSAHYIGVARDSISRIFAGTTTTDPTAGRYNLLLLGADAGKDRVGLRPDSMTLVSIDERTGRAAMFSFPRNLQRVPFPPGSVMHKQFPNGFDCGDECLLNAVYTWATDHKQLFPGDANPGITATEDAIRQLTGLRVNYYALIDMGGFEQLVDAVGGVRVNVRADVPITGRDGAVRGVIKAGDQRLDGYHALWYSRSRATTSDYDRMARQRCVMAAMLHQLDPATVLLKFQKIAEAGEQIVSTDIPASELGTMVDLALKAKRQKIVSVQFVPPLIRTARPDFSVIRKNVDAAIEASRQTLSASPTAKAAGRPRTDQASGSGSGGDSGGTSGSRSSGSGGGSSGESRQAVHELGEVCSAG